MSPPETSERRHVPTNSGLSLLKIGPWATSLLTQGQAEHTVLSWRSQEDLEGTKTLVGMLTRLVHPSDISPRGSRVQVQFRCEDESQGSAHPISAQVLPFAILSQCIPTGICSDTEHLLLLQQTSFPSPPPHCGSSPS